MCSALVKLGYYSLRYAQCVLHRQIQGIQGITHYGMHNECCTGRTRGLLTTVCTMCAAPVEKGESSLRYTQCVLHRQSQGIQGITHYGMHNVCCTGRTRGLLTTVCTMCAASVEPGDYSPRYAQCVLHRQSQGIQGITHYGMHNVCCTGRTRGLLTTVCTMCAASVEPGDYSVRYAQCALHW